MKDRDAIEMVWNEIASAPDEFLLMSRKNCHARMVDSVVVGRSADGGLRRIFLAWPNHGLYLNRPSGSLVVGIHDHRYSLVLYRLFGDVVNVDYEAASPQGVGWLYRMNRYSFRTAGCGGPPEAVRNGDVMVKESGRRNLRTVGRIELRHDDLHTVEVHSRCAAWLVCEGSTCLSKETTTLLTNCDPASIGSDESLYQGFESRWDVLASVAMWASAAEGSSPLANAQV